jgi:hypothetical protein
MSGGDTGSLRTKYLPFYVLPTRVTRGLSSGHPVSSSCFRETRGIRSRSQAIATCQPRQVPAIPHLDRAAQSEAETRPVEMYAVRDRRLGGLGRQIDIQFWVAGAMFDLRRQVVRKVAGVGWTVPVMAAWGRE